MPPPRRLDGQDDFIELTPPNGTPADDLLLTPLPPPPRGLPPDGPLSLDHLLLTPAPFVPPPDDPADTRGPLARIGRGLVLALPGVLLAAGVAAYVALSLNPGPPPAPRGKLVVLLAFDFLPGDKIDKWAPLFGPDGFERMKAEGTWLKDAQVPQAYTAAGPGFANLVTGAPPSGHGVVGDDPAEPLRPTVGDALKATGAGKVWAVGLDDRALCLAGRRADGVIGYDPAGGAFRAVGRPDPDWLAPLNAAHPADRWLGGPWRRLRPAALYDAVAGAERPGTGPGSGFPHPFGPPGGTGGPAYRAAVVGSPAGDELAWEAARAAIAGEQLGQRGETDLLCVALTAGGRVMRGWGPESHEAADALARADRLVAEVFAHLTAAVGPDRWAVVAAGCHGGCPLPEVEPEGRPPGERFDPAAEFGRLGEAMDEAYGRAGGLPGRWVGRIAYPWVTLNRKTLADRKVAPAEAAAFAAQWLGNRPAALAAYPRGGPFPDDAVGRAAAATFHPDRGGDVFLVHRPYAVPAAAGSAAGSPHPYDRGVAVLAVGAGVPAARAVPGRVSQSAAAPVLAKLLGVEPPSAEPLPRGFE